MGAVLATVDWFCGGGGRGLAGNALTDATSLATLRDLTVGSGTGSAGALIAALNAAYNTRGTFPSALPEVGSVEDEASRVALLSEPDGRSAAVALGAASENKQAIKSAAMNDRAVERRIRLNILHLCMLVFRIVAQILAQRPFGIEQKN